MDEWAVMRTGVRERNPGMPPRVARPRASAGGAGPHRPEHAATGAEHRQAGGGDGGPDGKQG